jgi:hypothetical protein
MFRMNVSAPSSGLKNPQARNQHKQVAAGWATSQMSSPPIEEHYIRFEVFTAMTMKNAIFWVVAPCTSCVNQCFRGMYCLHLHHSSVCSHLLTLVPRLQIFLPWRWRRYIPPKCRFKQDLHGSTSKKTAFFIVTAMKTSDLRNLNLCLWVLFWILLY